MNAISAVEPEINLNRADFAYSQYLFSALARMHVTPKGGVNCVGYSSQAKQALAYLSREAEKLGATVYVDRAGNHYAVFEPLKLEDKLQPALLMGSHIDAVPEGGQYDGMAGVIAPLQAMRILKGHGIIPQQTIVIPMFVNEESSRFTYALSSKIATGMAPHKILDTPDQLGGPDNAREALRQFCDGSIEILEDKIRAREALMPSAEHGAMIEVHIAQSDELADQGYQLGVVSTAFGNYRPGYVTFKGRADHTGTTPQKARQDAVLAGAYFVTELNKRILALASEHKDEGDLRIAFCDSRTPHPSQNVVSAQNEVLFDIRSDKEWLLAKARHVTEELVREVRAQGKVDAYINDVNPTVQKPIDMDGGLMQSCLAAARRLSLRVRETVSGAGHDSVVMQESGRASAIVFLAHKGGSHHSGERLTAEIGQDPFALNGSYVAATRLLMDYAMGKVAVVRRDITGPHHHQLKTYAQALEARGARQWAPMLPM